MSDVEDPGFFKAIGVFYLSGTVTYALGPTLQKVALRRVATDASLDATTRRKSASCSGDLSAPLNEDRSNWEGTLDSSPAEEAAAQASAKSWLWWIGITMYVSSGVLWAISLIFAPVSLLSPLLATAVLLNFVFTATLLKEKVKKRDVFAGLLLLASIVFAAVSAPAEMHLKIFFHKRLQTKQQTAD